MAIASRPLQAARTAVDRRFEAVMFDWDGTAVPDRHSDASRARDLIEVLCAHGMHLCIVTGTHVGNVDGQLRARPDGPGRLLIAVNRGSEVYEVNHDGPALLHRRDATEAENRALDRAAALTIDRLAARGLEADVVSQRLNRRKIDMIPVPAWSDPPKAQIDRLLVAVEHRLASAGLAGLPEVVELAEQAARDAGLDDPRVTSDAKHVEIGLTDKSDAARALLALLWDEEGIGPGLVLIAGDELGPLGGLPGSDSLMLVPEAARAVCVSVGVEPTGVPQGVLHLGGGPDRFCDVLADQLDRRRRRDVPEVDLEPGWYVTFDGVDHRRERAIEALLALADGTIGTTGAPLFAHPSARPGVVVAGLYRGEGPRSDLLEAPRWERVRAELGVEDQLSRALDLHTGVLAEHVEGSTTMRSVRFSSLARPGTGVLRSAAVPHVDPGPALTPVDGEGETITRERDEPECAVVRGDGRAVVVAAVQDAGAGETVDRIAVYEPCDAVSASPDVVVHRVRDHRRAGFDTLLGEHRRAWAARWEVGDVRIGGDDHMQLATRIGLYHLMASVADRGEAVVGARGLSGHGYRGHVFWDSDVFVLPYLAATHPPAARAMIEYRVRRLPQAFAAARAEGHRGARFAWESTAAGDDVTPASARDRAGNVVPIRTGRDEVHIVADVAWAACHYADWCGDASFAATTLHRILVETARYWASCVRVDDDGSAHLYGVIGPDEYHEPVDDDMFTNVMARWNLRRAAASARAHGAVDGQESNGWLELADALVDGFDPNTGIYEQFAGFYGLEQLLISEVAPRVPVVADLLLGRERVRQAQVVKQADVLMAHHLVPEELAPGSLAPNIEYYAPRTAHGSSLSPGVLASVLARARRLDDALQWLRVAADVDLVDLTNTTAGGVHLATMGSLWQALAWGFAGLRPLADSLVVDPRLPDEWDELEVRVVFHGVPVRVVIGHDATAVVARRPVLIRRSAIDVPRACGPGGLTLRHE
jgi:trehalose/maltose hydrolase-like predicted phosphorylase